MKGHIVIVPSLCRGRSSGLHACRSELDLYIVATHCTCMQVASGSWVAPLPTGQHGIAKRMQRCKEDPFVVLFYTCAHDRTRIPELHACVILLVKFNRCSVYMVEFKICMADLSDLFHDCV